MRRAWSTPTTTAIQCSSTFYQASKPREEIHIETFSLVFFFFFNAPGPPGFLPSSPPRPFPDLRVPHRAPHRFIPARNPPAGGGKKHSSRNPVKQLAVPPFRFPPVGNVFQNMNGARIVIGDA